MPTDIQIAQISAHQSVNTDVMHLMDRVYMDVQMETHLLLIVFVRLLCRFIDFKILKS